MAALSLKVSLKVIQEPRPGRSVLSIPSGFASFPQSLRLGMSAMVDPGVSGWYISREAKHEANWTDGLQGVANDGRYWYFARTYEGAQLDATKHEEPYIHRVDPKGFALLETIDLGLTVTGSTHIGDIDCAGGLIYGAMENPSQIVVVTTLPKLSVQSVHPLTGPQTDHPWCAINPWNGYYCTSSFYNAAVINMYDPKDGFKFKRQLPLFGADVDHAQGGVFTDNGFLLMTSDKYDDLRCFSAINGTYMGSVHIEKSHAVGPGQEIEGLTFWKDLRFNDGTMASVHVILVDINIAHNDTLIFKHYAIPDVV